MTIPPLHIGQIGLLFDIIGGFFLAKALFFNSVKMIAAQGGTYYGYNPHLILALCEQRIDANFGLPLLLLGFFFQFWATFDNEQSQNWTIFGAIVLIVVIFVYFMTRSILACRMRDIVIANKVGE